MQKMSVPLSKRSISEFEFYANAIRIRQRITEWLLRDFGIKPQTRNLENIAKRFRMNDSDRTVLADLLNKYGMGQQICETYPEWWVQERRRTIDKICADMARYIVEAFEIYPQTMTEYNKRRETQSCAIACVYALTNELQYVASVLFKTANMDMSRSADIAEMCAVEIALLKGWRKEGNRIRNAILKRESHFGEKGRPCEQISKANKSI